MGKWTKGPWKAHKANWHTWLVLHGWFQVAVVEMSEEMPEDEVAEQEKRAAADANLIAAAPELYEALEEFAKMFTDTKKYPDPETITTGLRILLPNALDALRKARGEKV